ncbi:Gfo/Idh/MocA family protein [Actinopolymorpha alba]|uniref:Gfo/Idh/MocA family protein n=1 Tax=Actinopolymorpha alba TaxID=533267 RepID=UPI00037591F2|nr:Gfo/Idh/MocA family oxidoreductase [Actinopolymorpha alba]
MPAVRPGPVRVGIIGAGIMGAKHAAAVAGDPRAEVAGVADVSLEAARKLAASVAAPLVSDDYAALLASDDIDLVTVATPDHLHAEICRRAARAGKHVLVEKPLTTNLAEADDLIDVVRSSGITAMVCFNHRWIPSYAQAWQEVAAGRIGQPVMAYARKNDRIYVPTEMLGWASATTPAWFLSSHDIDLVCWYLGGRAVEVYATAVSGVLRERGVETPDAIQAQVRFDHGAVATFESCWIYPNSYPSMTDSFIEIVGQSGVIHLERKSEQLEIAHSAAFEYPRTSIGSTIHGEERGAVPAALRHFITCVMEGREPLVTLESSRHVTAILDALHRSLASERPEDVR